MKNGTKLFLMILFAGTIAKAQMSQDQMKILFASGRTQAAQMVNSTLDCQIENSLLTPELKNWIKSNATRSLLAQDILSSIHIWNQGNYQSCASTSGSSKSDIQFSYNACLSSGLVTGKDEYRILIEQSLFHMGISDYYSAQSLAYFLSQPKSTCSPYPGTVWDSGICPQQKMTDQDKLSYLPTGGDQIQVGNHRFYFRSRKCNKLTGCTAFAEYNLKHLSKTYATGFSTYDLNIESNIPLQISTSYANGSSKVNAFYPEFQSEVKEYLLSFPGGSPLTFAAGGIFRTCTWQKYTATDATTSSANFNDYEVVFYGIH